MDTHLETILATVVKWAEDAIEIAGPDAKLIYVNGAFEKMTGYSYEEVKGKTPAQFLRSDRQDPEVYKIMWDTVSSGKPWSGQIFRKCKNGENRLFEITVAPVLDSSDAVTDYVAISRDVTQRIQEERRKLQLTEQVAFLQKQESLGLLAGRFAHDFNNLLTIISGNMELVGLDAPECSRKYVSDAQNAIGKAKELIQQMLLFSGGKTPKKEVLNPKEIIKSMEPLFTIPAGKNIAISYNLNHEDHKIVGDRTQIGQVLLNLITNASEAIGEDSGAITIKTKPYNLQTLEIHDRKLSPGPHLALTISDTGCGIAKEDLARIFDPFYSSKKNGHGLGLSSVMGIIKGHGGDVRVNSHLGRGTEFTILFPLIEEEEPGSMSVAEEKITPTVLVVDDDRLIRRMLSASLNRFSMRTIEAEDGLHGWELYQKNESTIDLVIFDQMMPRMKGMELLKLIREKNPNQKAILISGFRGSHPSQWETGHKPDHFVAKPFTPNELMKVVSGLLAQESLESSAQS